MVAVVRRKKFPLTKFFCESCKSNTSVIREKFKEQKQKHTIIIYNSPISRIERVNFKKKLPYVLPPGFTYTSFRREREREENYGEVEMVEYLVLIIKSIKHAFKQSFSQLCFLH